MAQSRMFYHFLLLIHILFGLNRLVDGDNYNNSLDSLNTINDTDRRILIAASTSFPTNEPTKSPTKNPTKIPTTSNPTTLTESPTTAIPTTSNPTMHPSTAKPTTAIPTTAIPTASQPTMYPSTRKPTIDPTIFPSTSTPTTSKPTVALYGVEFDIKFHYDASGNISDDMLNEIFTNITDAVIESMNDNPILIVKDQDISVQVKGTNNMSTELPTETNNTLEIQIDDNSDCSNDYLLYMNIILILILIIYCIIFILYIIKKRKKRKNGVNKKNDDNKNKREINELSLKHQMKINSNSMIKIGVKDINMVNINENNENNDNKKEGALPTHHLQTRNNGNVCVHKMEGIGNANNYAMPQQTAKEKGGRDNYNDIAVPMDNNNNCISTSIDINNYAMPQQATNGGILAGGYNNNNDVALPIDNNSNNYAMPQQTTKGGGGRGGDNNDIVLPMDSNNNFMSTSIDSNNCNYDVDQIHDDHINNVQTTTGDNNMIYNGDDV